MFIEKMLRIFCILIDRLAYWAQINIYELFINISEASVFKQTTIQHFASRLYAFLGLIMVFKVSISLVTYIMNPDNFNKADVGAPALLKGLIFALVGIVAVPYIFEAAYDLQRIVLQNNIIGNVILGVTTDDDGQEFSAAEGGELMAQAILTGFVRPNTDIEGIDDTCSDDPSNCSEFLDLFDAEDQSNIISAYTVSDSHKYVHPSDLLNMDLINTTTKTSDGKEVFVYHYYALIDTACVIFIAYILLIFCIDVALRTVKLSFLQLIAPIPLIARIDPKKGKQTFDKWVHECVTTYLSLFARLATIYFAVFLISAITEGKLTKIGSNETYSGFSGVLVEIFLIIGTLQFTKELPKLIGDLFGIKIDGGGLSLRNKIGSTPLIGGAMLAGGAFGLRAGREALAGGAQVGGALAGKFVNWAGNKSGLTPKLQSFGNSVSNKANMLGNRISSSKFGQGVSNLGHKAHDAGEWLANNGGEHFSNAASQIGLAGAGIAGAVGNTFGIQDHAMDRLEMEQASIMKKNNQTNEGIRKKQAVADCIKAMEDRAWSQITSGTAKISGSINGKPASNLSDQYRSVAAKLEAAKKSGNETEISAAQKEFDEFKDAATYAYMSGFNDTDASGKFLDGTLNSMYKDYVDQYAASDIASSGIGSNSIQVDGAGLHKQSSDLKTSISTDKRGMIPDNERLSEIKNEKERLQESIKSGKPFMPGPGAGKK